jgi:RNA polymerase sigma-70 factor (ECF subfamily)
LSDSARLHISDIFVRLIDEHQGIIHKICLVYTDDEDDRKDLFQEILLNAWRSFPSYEYRAKFSTWLYRVALNTALMGLRRRRPETIDVHSVADLLPAPPEPDREDVRILYRTIESLPPGDKALILLYLDDLSYQEISEITGLSENHVGVKINRIKKKLASRMEHVHG